MRRSGISQISAAITRIAWASQTERRVATIAMMYSTGDSLPFQSRPIAFFKTEFGPLRTDDRLLEQVVGDRRHQQHHSVKRGGDCGEMVFPIHPVANGNSESQNKRCRLAQSIAPFTAAQACEHVMVVVPVNADIDETQHVAEERRQQRNQVVADGLRVAPSTPAP